MQATRDGQIADVVSKHDSVQLVARMAACLFLIFVIQADMILCLKSEVVCILC